jgi:hypothetical protein
VLARWDRRGVWRNDQSLSPAARLSRELNAATRTTRSRLRRAHTFERVAAVTAVIEVGSVSADQVDLLAKAQRTAPERYAADEEMLIEQCATLRFADAERLVAYSLQHVDPDGAQNAAIHSAIAAEASVSETIDETVVVDATLTGLDRHVFVDALRRLTDAQRLADAADGVVRTARQRRAAALVEMATRSASTPAGARRLARCSPSSSATTRSATSARRLPAESSHPTH